MLTRQSLLILLDVDNTLFDNDGFKADLDQWLGTQLADGERARYWGLYEQLRQATGYADYLGALQSLRAASPDPQALLHASDFLLDYPFAERLYPGALAAVAHLATLAPVAIVSDGDMVFQPRKIRRSGLEQAVSGRVLVYLHKQDSLDDLQARLPAKHYVAIDDKPLLLAAMKSRLGARLSTVFVRQGHYAAAGSSASPPPDRCIDAIAELQRFRREDLLAPAAATTMESP